MESGISGLIALCAQKKIADVVQNSRKAFPGTVFVCITGSRNDGHDYAKSAYDTGCRIFVAEKSLSLPNDAMVVASEDTERDYALLCNALYGYPSRKMKVIGITGTKGKTTTALLFRFLMEANGFSCGYIGTSGIQYKNVKKETENTTPEAHILQENLAEMVKNGIEYAVLEVSSQALKRKRVDGMQFDRLIFTNLSEDHIGKEEHPDFEDYYQCKKRLFTDFPAKKIFALEDKPYAEKITENALTQRRFCKQPTDCKAILKDGKPGISWGNFHLPLVGKCNAENAVLAMACAEECGCNPATFPEILRNAYVEGRSECFSFPENRTVIIDYAHNGFALENLLSSLSEYHPQRLTVLVGSVGERTKGRRAELGEISSLFSDKIFFTADNPGTESVEGIISDIVKGMKKNTPYRIIPDRETAIQTAISEMIPDEILLLAGKGQETYQKIGQKSVPFSEQKIVKNLQKTMHFDQKST